MNFLVLSKIYKLLNENENECENCKPGLFKLKNYEELEQTLIDYGYDFIKNKLLIDVKYGTNIEEALATPEFLVLTSDNKNIPYSDVKFLITWFCTDKAVIAVKDDKNYCQNCFERLYKQQSFKKIKKILTSQDEMNGLSTSEKIKYILVKNTGKKLTGSDIYDLGIPWELNSFTPRNSVYARLSSLAKNGSITRDGLSYYI